MQVNSPIRYFYISIKKENLPCRNVLAIKRIRIRDLGYRRPASAMSSIRSESDVEGAARARHRGRANAARVRHRGVVCTTMVFVTTRNTTAVQVHGYYEEVPKQRHTNHIPQK